MFLFENVFLKNSLHDFKNKFQVTVSGNGNSTVVVNGNGNTTNSNGHA